MGDNLMGHTDKTTTPFLLHSYIEDYDKSQVLSMDSPYAKYFDTNYVPTVDETRRIQAILASSDAELSDLDAHIDKLVKQLGVIQEQRTAVSTFSEKHRALLSPMRRLGQDILEEIFLACLPTHRNPCMSSKEAPVLLTRVCSSWRTVAMSTPRLWAQIHIPLPVIKLGDLSQFSRENLYGQEGRVLRILKQRKTAVNEWLSKSGACPLSISIYEGALPRPCFVSGTVEGDKYYDVCENIQRECLSLILNTIIPHHKRCMNLDMCISNDTLKRLLLNTGLKAESLLLLNSFHDSRQHMCLPDRQTPPLPTQHHWNDVVALMPMNTTSATIEYVPVRPLDVTLISQYAWGRITELNLDLSADYNSESPVNICRFAASVLRHCHSLITLMLQMACAITEAFELCDGGDVTLPDLTTLSIALPGTVDGLAFVKSLYLPSLKDLAIGFDYWDINALAENSVIREINDTLLRTGENLNRLALYGPFNWITSTSFVKLLKLTPAIHHLKVSGQYSRHHRWPNAGHVIYPGAYRHLVNDELMQALTATSKADSEIICPQLEEFECDSNVPTDITINCLNEFVKSRQIDDRVSTLRRISLLLNPSKQDESFSEKVIQLGADSTIYFTKPTGKISYSPFDGFEKASDND